MNTARIGNRTRIGVLLALSTVMLLMLMMNYVAPALAQATATLRVGNLGQPTHGQYQVPQGKHLAQSFCTGSSTTTLSKVSIHTRGGGHPILLPGGSGSVVHMTYDTDQDYSPDSSVRPVVSIHSDNSGKPGAVVDTLTKPSFIDGSLSTAEDFGSRRGYELASFTTYWVSIHRPSASGFFEIGATYSHTEDSQSESGWSMGDRIVISSGSSWRAPSTRYGLRLAVYATGDTPSEPIFPGINCDGTLYPVAYNVEENAPAGTVVGTVVATDPEGDTLTYSVSGTDVATFNQVFTLNASTGVISVKADASPDYETQQRAYSVMVGATDGKDSSGNAEDPPVIDNSVSVTIRVLNMDDPGTVTFSTDTPRVGEQISAELSDPDRVFMFGKGYGKIRWQWSRSSTTAAFIEISGATSATYTPAAGDLGYFLRASVDYADHHLPGKFAKAKVANVVAAAMSQQAANTPATGTPGITGIPRPGQTLTATTSGIRDEDGMTNAVFGYQWVLDDPLTATDENISRATGSTYTVSDADAGKGIKVRVTFSDDAGNQESVTSSTVLAARLNSPATGAPAITGTAQVGETLTASTAGISDPDGMTNTTYSYQWLGDDAEIGGATGSSYTPVATDQGMAIKVRVSFTDDRGNAETLTSAATGVVAASAPTVIPDEEEQEEEETTPLTATTHGVPASHDGSAEFTFELRFSEEFGISYRTLQDHAFTVTGGEVVKARRLEPGKNVRWEITVRPSGNSDVTVELPATSACAAQGAICTGDGRMLSNSLEVTVSVQNFAATGAPAIAGTARVGETLTASTTSMADLDGLTNATFTYRWLADDIEIGGAAGSSYTLVAADRGKAIKVRVSFADDRGNAESLTSAATATVAASPPTVIPDEEEQEEEETTPLTATAHGVPASHDGSAAFTFELRFSEEFGISYRTLRDHAFTVTGGEVVKARRLEPGKNLRWRIHVRPAANAPVTIALPVTTDCSAQGAICAGDGRMLSSRLELTVSGPGS